MVAGFQVPAMGGLLVELVGNAGGVEFRHNGPICLNAGLICVTTWIFMVAEAAHWPVFGVNLYVVVPVRVVLITGGFQVPVIVGEFVELAGNAGGVEFRHKGPICLKVGLICATMVMVIFAVAPHCPAFGVKV